MTVITYTQDLVSILFILFNTVLSYPYTHVVHGDFYEEKTPKRWLKKLLWVPINRWLCTASTHIIVSSKRLQQRLIQKWKRSADKITIIPNAYSFRVSPAPRLYMNKSKLECITITSFTHREKARGVLDLIEYMQATQLENEISFTIVGGWTYREQLQQQVSDLHPSFCVTFTWYVAPEAMRKFLEIADIFVYCSYLDNGPLVLLEAIDAWIPVLSNDIGYVPELLVAPEDVYGWVYTTKKAFCTKFIHLAKDASFRKTFAEKQHTYARTHFGMAASEQQWREYLDRLATWPKAI
jgi:glycosyltransferase involved in cell wall biosynthesis